MVRSLTTADVREMFGVSSTTANWIFAVLAEDGKIQKIRIGKPMVYRLAKGE